VTDIGYEQEAQQRMPVDVEFAVKMLKLEKQESACEVEETVGLLVVQNAVVEDLTSAYKVDVLDSRCISLLEK
jgi:hypothetical protein